MKGQIGAKWTNFNFKEGERQIEPIHLKTTLEPFAKAIKWGNFGENNKVNKEK